MLSKLGEMLLHGQLQRKDPTASVAISQLMMRTMEPASLLLHPAVSAQAQLKLKTTALIVQLWLTMQQLTMTESETY